MKRRTGIIIVAVAGVAAMGWRTCVSKGQEDGARDRDASRNPARKEARAARLRALEDMRRAPRAAILGTVRGPSGQALALADVCAAAVSDELAAEEKREPLCARTGPDGTYRIDNLLPFQYMVFASAPRHLPRSYEREDGQRWLHLSAGEYRDGVDFELQTGAVELSGVVLDIGGGPVANAFVQESQPGPFNSAVTYGRSDDDGRFTLWVKPGDIYVSATADGYAQGGQNGKAPGQFIEVTLTPESILAGRVVESGTERPVAGALVKVGGRGAWYGDWEFEGWGSATTDEDGQFRITRLTPGRYKPTASATGTYGESRESVLLGVGETRDDLLIEAHPAFVLSGAIVIGEDRRPCQQGWVELLEKDSGRSVTGQTDTDGSVLMRAVLAGFYEVDVRCLEHVSRADYAPVVIADSDVAGLSWAVYTGAEILGTVVGANGEPVEGASVTAMPQGEFRFGQRGWVWGKSDASGHFVVRGLVAANYRVDADAEGFPDDEEPVEVDLTQRESVEIELVLEMGGTIDGVVVDEAGQPVRNIDVRVDRENGGYSSARSHTLDDGTFHIAGVSPGMVLVSAGRGHFTTLRMPGQREDNERGEVVTVRSGQTTEVRLVVESQSGEIRGRIVDKSGAPVGDAFVSAYRESNGLGDTRSDMLRSVRRAWSPRDPVLVDPDGNFTLKNLSNGVYAVRGYRRGGGEAIAESVKLGSDITLTIEGTTTIAGTVTSEDGRAPGEFTVMIRDQMAGFSRSERFFRVADGSFVIRDLPAGKFTVLATAAEGVAMVERTLAENESADDVALTLEPLLTITGRLVDLDSKAPISGVMVRIAPVPGKESSLDLALYSSVSQQTLISDKNGRFEARRVRPGAVEIYLYGVGLGETALYDSVSFRRTLSGRGTVDLGDITMARQRVSGESLGGSLGYAIAWRPPDKASATELKVARVDPDGPAAESGLASGDIIVSVDGHDVTGEQRYLYESLTLVPEGTTVTLGLGNGKTAVITATSRF